MSKNIKYKFFSLTIIALFIISILFAAFFGTGVRVSAIESKSIQSQVASLTAIDSVQYGNEEIQLSCYGKISKPFNKNVAFDYTFYVYETNKNNYYVANLLNENSGLINFSIESSAAGDILNIAFYDKELNHYTYYYRSCDKSFADRIKKKAVNSEELDAGLATTVFAATKWYKNAYNGGEVQNIDIPGTYDASRKKLETFYVQDAQLKTQIAHEKTLTRNRIVAGNEVREDGKYVEAYASADTPDAPITWVVPRSYFAYAGRKTGSDGTIGYFVDTIQWPENSGRYISEVLVWSNLVSKPGYDTDAVTVKTIPEFSRHYEYAKNGFGDTNTPADTIVELDDRSQLAIKNIDCKINVIPSNSYYLGGVYYDKDEYFYSLLGENNGKKYPVNGTWTGYVSTVAGIASLAANVIPFPGIAQALSVGLGIISSGFAVADTAITYNNGINESFSSGDRYVHANFIAGRDRHYNINGGKYVRQIRNDTATDLYFAPNNHSNFTNMNVTTKLTGYLNDEGTDTYTAKKLSVQNDLDIISLTFYWWFGEQKNETYLTRKSMTQEITYYRYYNPYT